MSPTDSPTIKDTTVAEAVDRLLKDPHSVDQRDRRDEQRQPFFRPVTIIDASDNSVSAFALDISSHGIRFVHSNPVEEGAVTIVICSHSEDPVKLQTDIEWCEVQPWGRGWYMCGGRFLGLAEA